MASRRPNMITKIILTLATCSVSCSFMLLFWSLTLDSSANNSNRQPTRISGKFWY